MAYLPFATALIGRLAELSTLTALLDEAQKGRGSIALLTGPPGIGKSRLAQALSDLAERHGMTTLWGRNFEGEGARSFAPWVEALGGYARKVEPDRLLQQLGPHAPVVARIVPSIRDALAELPVANPSPADGEDRLGLFDAVVPFVLAVAKEHPLLLVFDDLQWADRASLALLRHLSHHVANSQMAIVCTFREEEVISGEPLADLLPMLRREAPCQQVVVHDLTLAECSALVADVLQRSSPTQAAADDALVGAVVDRAGGNPFYIQEIVKDLVDTGQLQRQQNLWVAASPPAGWDVPREVRDILERRVRRLPETAQRLLRAACACTAGFSFADARALTDYAEEPLLESIDAALQANMLHILDPTVVPARYDFAHALIRDTLYGRLNPDRRARLHLKTAQALERGPVTDDVVAALAMHYLLAGRLAAPAHSIEYAVRAGEVAQASFAYEDAVTHWQTALDLMELHAVDPARRAALYEKLGDQLLITDPGDERALASHEKAIVLYEQAGLTESATRVNFRIAILFSTIASERQDVPRALRHARAATQSMSTEDQALRAQIEATYSCACFFSLQLDDALAASLRAMNALSELDVEGSSQHHQGLPREARLDVLRAIVFIHRGFCVAGAGELATGQALLGEAFDIAVRRSLPFFACIAAVWSGMVRCDLLDPGDARRWFESELAQPRSSRAPVQRQWLAFCNARARLMMGEQADVVEELPPGGLFRATLDAARAYLAGDWPACRAAATVALDVARRRGNLYVECWALHQLARLALAEDDAARAEDLLVRSLEQLGGQHRPFEALVSADLALLYAGQCRTDEALAALNQCRASLEPTQDWRGLRGRLLLAEAVSAAERRVRDADTCFAEAIAAFRRYRLPWDEAQALELRGTTCIRSGHGKDGDRYLDAAATIYRRHAAGPAWLQRVARLRAAAHNGYAPEALLAMPEGLSHREVEVLRLVAAGRSNQEIADALVLSVRTVERHLGHVYDKLGASGKSARAVATAYSVANGLVPPPAS